MTVSNEVYRHNYVGNDSTVLFAIGFYFLVDAHIKVVLYNSVTDVETELNLTTHYNLTGAGDVNGGELTMIIAPTSDETLTILRNVDLKQEKDYVEGTTFPAEDHEDAIDKLTMLVQQTQEKIERNLSVALSQSGTWTLPTPFANHFLRYNAAANAFENFNIADLSLYIVSALAESLLDDADASAFLTTLGIDTDVLTLALPADTTISDFVKTLLDDAGAIAFLTTLGLDTDILTLTIPANVTISALANTLLDDLTTSAFLTTLGLDTDLLTLALPANTTISDFAKTFLDDADAGAVRTTIGAATIPVGVEFMWSTDTPPTGYHEEDGAEYSMTTYEDLYDVLGNDYGINIGDVVTYTNATNLVNHVAHTLSDNDVIEFTNSGGALPTGLLADTKYFIISSLTDSYQVSLTLGGAAVTFSDDGTGTNREHAKFKVPDSRGEFIRGWDHGRGKDPDTSSRTDRGDGTTGDYVGTKESDEVEAHTHGSAGDASPDIALGSGSNGITAIQVTQANSVNWSSGYISSQVHTHTSVGGSTENRPVNINKMIIIKY